MHAWVVCLSLGSCTISVAQTDFAIDRRPVANHTPAGLLHMSEVQLVELYTAAPPSPVPTGCVPGLLIFKPGTHASVPVAALAKLSAWQGKYFRDDRVYNRTFLLPTVSAPIEMGTSYLDGRPSLIFDYADSRLCFVRPYRDEVREVSPGVHLGIMHRRDSRGATVATWFVLDGRCSR